MRSFDQIFEISAIRHGGAAALNARLAEAGAKSPALDEGDDRWLSRMTRAIFQAGFSWKVVEAKWPGFETAFGGFDVAACAMMDDEWFDRLITDPAIIRNGTKIRAVQENAVFVSELAQEYGSAGKAFREWPARDFVGLLELMKRRGARLGGTTGQYFLRFSGVDSFILSRDVVARLIAEGVIDKPPTSKTAMRKTQDAFNTWMDQSGRLLTEISRVLAMSTG